jgi:hypothetical protein
MMNQKNKIAFCNSLVALQFFCVSAADAQPTQKNHAPLSMKIHINRLNNEIRSATLTFVQSTKEKTKHEKEYTLVCKDNQHNSFSELVYAKVLKCLIHTALSPIPDDPPFWDLSMF